MTEENKVEGQVEETQVETPETAEQAVEADQKDKDVAKTEGEDSAEPATESTEGENAGEQA